MTADPIRRRLLQGIASAGGVAALGGPAFGQQRTIAASSFAGAWEQALRTILVPAYQKATGAGINLVVSNPADTISKLIASRGGSAPFDVVLLDEGPSLTVPQEEVFERIPVERMPNLKDLPKKFIDSRGYSVYCSAQIIGIAYNTEKIKTPPRSWNDLLRPEFKGRVGLAAMAGTMTQAWMAEIAKLNGGSEANLEPAFQFVKKLLPSVSAITPTPGALAALFQQGQVDIAVHYNNNVGDLQSKGVPIALAKPDTGFVVLRSTMHITKNTKHADLAAAYINAAVSVEVQSKMSAAPYHFVPTNSKVPFSGGLRALAKDMNEIESFSQVDWAKLNPRRLEYIERFNREIKI
jgi:putative spermidine/putrescine transport system substrate-binding protein